MKRFKDGTILIQAAEDFGGFYQVAATAEDEFNAKVQAHLEKQLYANRFPREQVEARYTTYMRGDRGVTVGGGMSMSHPGGSITQTQSTEPERKGQRNRHHQDDVAAKQKAIHDAIKAIRSKEPMSYDVAWQRLQSQRPELFAGLEDKVIHPD